MRCVLPEVLQEDSVGLCRTLCLQLADCTPGRECIQPDAKLLLCTL